jgi:hypothetical protein
MSSASWLDMILVYDTGMSVMVNSSYSKAWRDREVATEMVAKRESMQREATGSTRAGTALAGRRAGGCGQRGAHGSEGTAACTNNAAAGRSTIRAIECKLLRCVAVLMTSHPIGKWGLEILWGTRVTEMWSGHPVKMR